MVGRQKFHYRRKHAEDAAQWQFSCEFVWLRIENEKTREIVRYFQGMIQLQVATSQNNQLWSLLSTQQIRKFVIEPMCEDSGHQWGDGAKAGW